MLLVTNDLQEIVGVKVEASEIDEINYQPGKEQYFTKKDYKNAISYYEKY